MTTNRLCNVLLIVSLFVSCNTKGHRGTSISANDSRARKTYLYKCKVFAQDKKFEELLLANIKEIFVENSWFVDSRNSPADELVNYVLVAADTNFWNSHKIDGFTYTNMNTLVHRLERYELSDTLKLTLRSTEDDQGLVEILFVREFDP